MRITVFASILSMLFATGCGSKDGDGDTGGDESSGEPVDAALLYTNNCSACHAADGSSGTATDLTVAVPNLSDTELMDVLQNGTGSMPAPSLDSNEEDGLFLHLRDRFGEHGGT